MRVAGGWALALLAVLLISAGEMLGVESGVRVVLLNCETNPEVVTIQNLGNASQNLAGWELRSDPLSSSVQNYDLSQVGALDPGEQASFFSGSAAPETDAGAGQYRWTLSFIFRNNDPSDFARLVDDQDGLVDQLNCGDPPPATATATMTLGPTLVPTATLTPSASSTPEPTPVPAEDSDGDGCSDEHELQPKAIAMLGGGRDPFNFWDFFDVPTGAGLSRDGSVASEDIFGVIGRFNATDVGPGDFYRDSDPLSTPNPVDVSRTPEGDRQNYHPGYDRGSLVGPNAWNPGPADGAVAAQDIFAVIAQFGHSCLAPVRQLEVHHIDVEQGDAALIVSPGGETAMVDNGGTCSNTVSYLQGLGITSIDYHFASHYHADHIGCLDDLASAGIEVVEACYDRGGAKANGSLTFDAYVATCESQRQTLTKGQVITLDAGAAYPVTITVVALDGAGLTLPADDENERSLVLRLTYGSFNEVLGGDLTGEDPNIESLVAEQVGDVEVYKVHHHGSATSSNDAWLIATAPEVAIISVGANGHGHPTDEALDRLHSHSIQTYWTNLGSGASPDPDWDQVGGDIVIEATHRLGGSFKVSGDGFTDTFSNQ